MEALAHPEALVTARWLHEHLDNPDLRIVDVRYSLMGPLPDDYVAGHVPGATFCNLHDDTFDLNGEVPCRIADAERFEASMSRLGIDATTHVVVHDQDFGGWAARLWWALRYYGHDNVSVLDGGLAAWSAAGTSRGRAACRRVATSIAPPDACSRRISSPRSGVR